MRGISSLCLSGTSCFFLGFGNRRFFSTQTGDYLGQMRVPLTPWEWDEKCRACFMNLGWFRVSPASACLSWKRVGLKIESSSPSWPSDLVPEFGSWRSVKHGRSWCLPQERPGPRWPTTRTSFSSLTASVERPGRRVVQSWDVSLVSMLSIILMDFLFSLLQNELIWSEKKKCCFSLDQEGNFSFLLESTLKSSWRLEMRGPFFFRPLCSPFPP